MLAVLRHLNYQPWYALAEFVDNSVESFLKHREGIEQLHGQGAKLQVSIDIDPSQPARISIKDNAAGIFEHEYARAFRAAEVPPDRSGLSEFGMGMKSAACWFAPIWTVRTSALGEPTVRSVHFDIANIVDDNIQELQILEMAESPSVHYTEVVLEEVFRVPVKRTLGKVKEHLTDIYREFFREGVLELRVNGELLHYEPPAILVAPYFKNQDGPTQEWIKQISFDFGDGLSVRGFAALRETASASKAGFALFRRGRVIVGSGDEGFRPHSIFGKINSFRYIRLFGELHLEGFEVSHTKDGFQWGEDEEAFLDCLREHLDSEELPLLKQGEGYRARVSRDLVQQTADAVVESTSEAMRTHLPGMLPALVDAFPVETSQDVQAAELAFVRRQFDVRFRDTDWSVEVSLTDDPAESQWLQLNASQPVSGCARMVAIRLGVGSPFMVRFAQGGADELEALLRVAVALGIGEVVAGDSGVRNAASVRRNVNELLALALSQP